MEVAGSAECNSVEVASEQEPVAQQKNLSPANSTLATAAEYLSTLSQY